LVAVTVKGGKTRRFCQIFTSKNDIIVAGNKHSSTLETLRLRAAKARRAQEVYYCERLGVTITIDPSNISSTGEQGNFTFLLVSEGRRRFEVKSKGLGEGNKKINSSHNATSVVPSPGGTNSMKATDRRIFALPGLV
jgi:hypothetical protein